MPTFRTWCPDFGDTEVDAVSVEAFAHADAAEKAAETLHSSTGGRGRRRGTCSTCGRRFATRRGISGEQHDR